MTESVGDRVRTVMTAGTAVTVNLGRQYSVVRVREPHAAMDSSLATATAQLDIYDHLYH
jgi:hypothetical protein